MTDRLKGFIVTLDQDIRDDDAEQIIAAIQMVKHVANVAPMVADPEDYMARVRVRSEIGKKIMDLVRELTA